MVIFGTTGGENKKAITGGSEECSPLLPPPRERIGLRQFILAQAFTFHKLTSVFIQLFLSHQTAILCSDYW